MVIRGTKAIWGLTEALEAMLEAETDPRRREALDAGADALAEVDERRAEERAQRNARLLRRPPPTGTWH